MAASLFDVSVVKENCSQLGEGPHWDETTERLIWVDILGHNVHLLDIIAGKDVKYNFHGPVGAAVPRKRGGSLLVAVNRNFTFLDLETGQKEVVASVDGWAILGRYHGSRRKASVCKTTSRIPVLVRLQYGRTKFG